MNPATIFSRIYTPPSMNSSSLLERTSSLKYHKALSLWADTGHSVNTHLYKKTILNVSWFDLKSRKILVLCFVLTNGCEYGLLSESLCCDLLFSTHELHHDENISISSLLTQEIDEITKYWLRNQWDILERTGVFSVKMWTTFFYIKRDLFLPCQNKL